MHIFNVQDYGADPNAADNRAAIMAAHDALKAAGGGVLDFGGCMYWVDVERDANNNPIDIFYQQYRLSVSLPFTADWLIVRNGGVIQRPITPNAQHNNLSVIACGHWTPALQPDFEAMPTQQHVHFIDFTIDCNGLDLPVAQEFGEVSPSGVLGFFKTDGIWLENVTIRGGWGYNGAIYSLLDSKHITTFNCNVHGRFVAGANNSYTPVGAAAFWWDGAHYAITHDCYADYFRNIVVLATNGDIQNPPGYNIVAHVTGRNYGTGTGVNVHGGRALIADCDFETDRGQSSGVQLFGTVLYPSAGDLVVNNHFRFVHPNAAVKSGQVVKFATRHWNPYVQEWQLGTARDHVILNNTGDQVSELVKFDSAGCINNVISGNDPDTVTAENGALLAANVIVTG